MLRTFRGMHTISCNRATPMSLSCSGELGRALRIHIGQAARDTGEASGMGSPEIQRVPYTPPA